MYNLQKIRHLCRLKNISLNELARRIGIKPAGMQYILKRNSTTQSRLEKIANVLDVDVAYFLGEQNGDVKNPVSEPQENYGYKEKYISILEEYNKLLKEKTECTKTNKHSESKK